MTRKYLPIIVVMAVFAWSVVMAALGQALVIAALVPSLVVLMQQSVQALSGGEARWGATTTHPVDPRGSGPGRAGADGRTALPAGTALPALLATASGHRTVGEEACR